MTKGDDRETTIYSNYAVTVVVESGKKNQGDCWSLSARSKVIATKRRLRGEEGSKRQNVAGTCSLGWKEGGTVKKKSPRRGVQAETSNREPHTKMGGLAKLFRPIVRWARLKKGGPKKLRA